MSDWCCCVFRPLFNTFPTFNHKITYGLIILNRFFHRTKRYRVHELLSPVITLTSGAFQISEVYNGNPTSNRSRIRLYQHSALGNWYSGNFAVIPWILPRIDWFSVAYVTYITCAFCVLYMCCGNPPIARFYQLTRWSAYASSGLLYSCNH